ncbi:MAG: hypothetical protein FVQ84_22695 [Planctomycetes bacterium]|nr:hypothetical protein [Planctomycetota bacterium]
MKLITCKHMTALHHAILFVRPALAKTQNPRTRRAIQLDLDRLEELNKIIMYHIVNPEIDFVDRHEIAGPDLEYEKTQEFTPREMAEVQD